MALRGESRRWIVVLCALLLLGSCGDAAAALNHLSFNQELATRWAPIHFQDVDQTGAAGAGGIADYLSAINYDGDWDTRNNWDNLELNPLAARVYYSVVATRTHWFIIYAFYHPRDWSDLPVVGGLDNHENDLEGLLAIVRRPKVFSETNFGELLGIVTVFHNDFFSYTPATSDLVDGAEDIDGELKLTVFDGVDRPRTAQEAKGHGLKAEPYVKIKGGDGIRYLPSGTGEVPTGPNDRNVGYELVNMLGPGGLWERRDNELTFAEFGKFSGDDGRDDSAKAPWAWDDGNDGNALTGGELAIDPAKLVDVYFDGLGMFERTYTYNRYQSISCDFPEGC